MFGSASTSKVVPAVDFPRFAQLPAELREEIWEYCLPERVCELTSPVDDIVFWRPGKHDGPWPCELFHTTTMNALPPLITLVCHESRSVAFKTGKLRTDSFSDQDMPDEAAWCGNTVYTAWQDPARDSAHLNWTSAYTGEYQYVPEQNALQFLSWETSKLLHGGSMMINYLDRRYGSINQFDELDDEDLPPLVRPPIVYPPDPLSPSKLMDLDALEKISNWRVVMKVVVAHSDAKKAAKAGLFGLLGDARVQIIDVAAGAKTKAYLNFAQRCELKAPALTSQDFDQEPLATLEQKLREVVLDEFRSEELAARLRPAIMFRLCTRDCNHVGYEYKTHMWLGLPGHYLAGYGYDIGKTDYNPESRSTFPQDETA